MRIFFIFLLFIFTVFTGYTQSSTLSQIPKSAKNIMDFIPKDYDTLATANGDLNKDKKDDIVMVVVNKKESNFEMEKEAPRLLIILFKNKNGYELATASDKSIMCIDCGGIFGDPFESIEIKNNVLTIKHYAGSAWRWGYVHRYRFQNNDFYLIGQKYYSYWKGGYCDKYKEFAATKDIEENFLTGEYRSKEINHDCTPFKKEHRKNPIKPLQKLSLFNINKNIE